MQNWRYYTEFTAFFTIYNGFVLQSTPIFTCKIRRKAMQTTLISIACYLVSLLFIMPMLLRSQPNEQTGTANKTVFFVTALLAIATHFSSLIPTISHIFTGEDFTLMEIGSLISVIISALVSLALVFKIKTAWFMLPIVYSLSVINLIFAQLFPSHIIHNLLQNTGLLIHIFLALFTYAVCFIATLYSFQLVWLHKKLKNKKTGVPLVIPPLMLIERHFFRVLLVAEALLTLTLVSGAIYLSDFFAPQNIQKATFSFLAWVVFGSFILGHWKFYWRGKRMIIYMLTGFLLLTIAYFGSRAMMSF